MLRKAIVLPQSTSRACSSIFQRLTGTGKIVSDGYKVCRCFVGVLASRLFDTLNKQREQMDAALES